MQNHQPEALAAILQRSPEFQQYNRDVRAAIAERWSVDPNAPVCETCGGTGKVRARNIPINHPKFGQLFPCSNPTCSVLSQQRAERYTKLCTLAQIPDGYEELSFASWNELAGVSEDYLDGKRPALGAALAFFDARDRGFLFTLDEAADCVGAPVPNFDSGRRCSVVFTGTTGMGKTSLAVSVARALLNDRRAVVYVQLREFLDALKERFQKKTEYELGGDAEDEVGVLRTYQQAPVLIIDEFGIDSTDWNKQRAYDLVDYRYKHRLPTIVTTNYSADQLTYAWGLPTGHRLQAMAHWVEIGGLELRPRNDVWRVER